MYEQQSYSSQSEQYEFPQFKIKMDPLKVLGHHKIWIENIPILFPQKPYDVQSQYMKSVISALNGQQNALLQSPTGTGKTLALLCATLAWVNAGNRKSKIIYSSRTHSQLQQVAKELKKLAYQPNVCILGSRNLLCINDKLISENQGDDLNNKCNKLVRREKEERCPYYSRENIELVAQNLQNQTMDIEDFKTYCRVNDACPFYVERERMKTADIILLPYNYLLQMQLRNYIDVSDSIIIFDEAHNVVQAAEDGYSFNLSQQTIINGIKKLEKSIEEMQKVRPDAQDYQDPTSFQFIAQTMQIISNHLNGLLSTYSFVNNDEYCLPFNGRVIIKILSHYFSQHNEDFNFFVKLTQNYKLANEAITDEELDTLEKYRSFLHDIRRQNHPGPKIKGLLNFTDSVNRLFDKFIVRSHERQTIDQYKLFIQKQGDNQITLSMVCLDPSIAFTNFFKKGVYSIIITSGTLTPFDSWSEELKIKFKIKLDNNHLPNISYNVKGFIIKQFNFSFIERKDEQQILKLGQMIFSLCDFIPNGILLVFSSYQLMNMIKLSWAYSRILECLSNKKDLFFEPQSSSDLKKVFKGYQEKAKKKGAILFCVQRGKVSEGIDFSDELCRAVFLIGVPYLAIQDHKVQEKMKFIDNQQSILTGNEWYAQQAIRSANQALGRVIRHKNDYGAVFLCDSRYQIGQLSKWVQPAIKTVPYLNDQQHVETKDFFEIKGHMINQNNYS